ncbi:MAG TPA: hypothetical protein VGP89_18235 [Candidatus Angelobacter sp.]|nr:hypothetical protein [Candidatus Angelobacter sp.]
MTTTSAVQEVENLSDALSIIEKARFATYRTSTVVWEKLRRITTYLETQQRNAFKELEAQ